MNTKMYLAPEEAVERLEAGAIVAVPTETVYGLAGRIDRETTLREIFTAKGRPFFDPLIVHVADLSEAKSLASNWPEIFDVLAANFWPGPMTLVAPKAEHVSSLITSGLPTVAVRCPRHPIAEKILRALKVPLAAPSANLFGHTSPTSAAHVIQEFGDRVPVVDGGPCEVGVESTVLTATAKATGGWDVEILRPGGVSRAELETALARAGLEFSVTRAASTASPGHLPHHYQPSSPLVIVHGSWDDTTLLETVRTRLAEKGNGLRKVAWLELNVEVRQAARELYQSFRDLSREGQLIAVRYLPDYRSNDWEAVWDRVQRAASLTVHS